MCLFVVLSLTFGHVASDKNIQKRVESKRNHRGPQDRGGKVVGLLGSCWKFRLREARGRGFVWGGL